MDATDRKLLAILADDATIAFRDLGERLGLSAPSVYERVKKLKAQGVIKRTTIEIDGEAIGCPLLAFVHVTTEGWGKTPEMSTLIVWFTMLVLLPVATGSPSVKFTNASRCARMIGTIG